jgi:hypothetical protein
MMRKRRHVAHSELLAELDDAADEDIAELQRCESIADSGQRRPHPDTGEPEIVWRVRGLVSFMRMKRAKRNTAYHEAGHAVTAHVLGVHVRKIIVSAGLGGIVKFVRLIGRSNRTKERAILILMAGSYAQRRYAPHSSWCKGGGTDIEMAAALVRQMRCRGKAVEIYVQNMAERAQQLVEQHWDAIERLARALSREVGTTEMSGAQMRSIIDSCS